MPNRYLCDVLEEMRKCNETRNYGMLAGLIEEAQTMGNRMEAALSEQKDYHRWHDKVKKERAEYRSLLKETNKLRKATGKEEKAESRY